MKDSEIALKEGFDSALQTVKRDFVEESSPFINAIAPIMDVLDALAFFFYKTGFYNGMNHKEIEDESRSI